MKLSQYSKVLFQTATSPEFKALEHILGECRKHSPAIFKNTVLLCGGLGSENAYNSCLKFIDDVQPDLVIDIGSAGALSSDIKTGDVFVATKIIGRHESLELEDSKKLLDFSSKLIVHEPLYSEDRNFFTLEERLAQFHSTQAVATCWEAIGVARACQEKQIPFLSIRIITDTSQTTENLKKENVIKEFKKWIREVFSPTVRKLFTALN